MGHHLAQLNIGLPLDEAEERLDHVRAHGPAPYAFTFRQSFDLAPA